MSLSSSKFNGDQERNSQKGQIWFMFPMMYNSDILVELTSPNEDTGPLNKDRLKLQRKALKSARRYFRDFLIYLNNCLYLTE